MSYKLYTTKYCSFCPSVKKYLDMKKVQYEVVDVTDDHKQRLELQKAYNVLTVPFLLREDGQHAIGFNIAKINAII